MKMQPLNQYSFEKVASLQKDAYIKLIGQGLAAGAKYGGRLFGKAAPKAVAGAERALGRGGARALETAGGKVVSMPTVLKTMEAANPAVRPMGAKVLSTMGIKSKIPAWSMQGPLNIPTIGRQVAAMNYNPALNVMRSGAFAAPKLNTVAHGALPTAGRMMEGLGHRGIMAGKNIAAGGQAGGLRQMAGNILSRNSARLGQLGRRTSRFGGRVAGMNNSQLAAEAAKGLGGAARGLGRFGYNATKLVLPFTVGQAILDRGFNKIYAGQLTPEQQTEFEEMYADNQSMRDQLNMLDGYLASQEAGFPQGGMANYAPPQSWNPGGASVNPGYYYPQSRFGTGGTMGQLAAQMKANDYNSTMAQRLGNG